GPRGPGAMQSEVDELLAKHEDDLRKAAEREVRLWYIINAISKKENISASKEEVEEEMNLMADSLRISIQELKKKYSEHNLYRALEYAIVERKTFAFVADNSTVTEKKE
ncbi:MAG: hypothetical protein JXA66_06925, partial [Oligoflexia bacterium]|nr:hypothetical protein [Oligoflexia bacterium]